MIRPPEYVSSIQPYIPGKPIEELEREIGISGSIKLASNENPVGPSPFALDAIKDSFADINRYPDGSSFYLKKALSDRLSVSEDEIIIGNGSNELIDIAVRTFLQAGDDAVMAAPSFVVYSIAVRAAGGNPVEVPLKNYTHDLVAMADAITPKTKMLFIANPNNPTGTINKKDDFDRMVGSITSDILLVVDEAYYEYVLDHDFPDTMKYLRGEKNLLILRTFSKIYGLAGLRLGYGLAKKEIISDMNRIREPFNTNTIAQRAAIEALKDKGHVSLSREINEKGKKYLYRELDSLGIKYIPTEANFIYILLENDAKSLYEKLLKKGVIVRPVGPKQIRVTIGLPEENIRFIEAMKTVFGM
ncbi:MAG: histidinol-phosphate transaminase [Nitrospirota bacterium]